MKNSNPELDKVISTMADLDRSLKSWRDQLPSYIDFDKPVDAERLPHSVRPQHFFYLLYSYYGSLIAIYSILVQPWNAIAIRVDQSQKELLGWEVKNSSDIIVEASRKVIEHLPHIKVDPSTPKWFSYTHPKVSHYGTHYLYMSDSRLVLTFPLTALFNLFVHVLRHPTLPTTESDITLMYTASGHFSYLEFLSPELNFPLTRELANLARKAVSEGRKKSKQLNTNASLSLSRVQPSKEACGTSWPLFYDVSYPLMFISGTN